MTMTRRHGPYGVSIGATLLGGITRQNLVTGTEVRGEATSGEVYARIQALYHQGVAPGFSTMNVAAALALCGYTGGNIAAMSGGLSLYAQKHLAGGTRTTSGAHRKYNFTAGILAPRSLSVDHRGDATLSYDAVVTFDGSNDPVVITDSFSLPSGLTDAERFTMGPATIAGIALSQKVSVQIDFGLDVVGESGDSDIWDTLASIREIHTVLTFRGKDIEWLKDSGGFPLEGSAGTHVTSIFYLRKRASGGTFVADGEGQHVKFTACGLAYIDTAIDAGKDAAQCGLRMPLRFDGDNAPLTINTASAIQ